MLASGDSDEFMAGNIHDCLLTWQCTVAIAPYDRTLEVLKSIKLANAYFIGSKDNIIKLSNDCTLQVLNSI